MLPIGLACAGLAVVFASTGGATVPPTGVNCAVDGKISGRGATFAQKAQDAWAAGFRDDVCGKVTDTVGDNMVVYNNPTTGDNGAGITGSGAGRNGQQCRSDAF